LKQEVDLGLLQQYAADYIAARDTLSKRLRWRWPVLQVCGQAYELTTKCALVAQGMELKALARRPCAHDLVALLSVLKARQSAWVCDERHVELLRRFNAMHFVTASGIRFMSRFPDHRHLHMKRATDIEEAVDSVVRQTDHCMRKLIEDLRSLGLTSMEVSACE
jgi:hypothetical protein